MGANLHLRSAGILLAVSSLPSRYGIGAFGKAAHDWLDFLSEAEQRYWQILPLGPTGWGDSPYMSFSAFALSPYYIDFDELAAMGLISTSDIDADWGGSPERVDYAALFKNREPVLRRAFAVFRENGAAVNCTGGSCGISDNIEAFRAKNAAWLPDYALFMALKAAHNGKSWLEWEEPLRFRDKKALSDFRAAHSLDIEYHEFTQFIAFKLWDKVKSAAAKRGIFIMGDMPVYVALDSADTWAHPELFQLGADLKPTRVAGCPPDPFAANGQLWGNPLYRWDFHEKTGFAWWISRLRASLELYDVVRIDHFRGFESYFSIDAAASDARGGEWIKGPDIPFIKAVNAALPGAAIIAEDLGYLTDEVRALLEVSGYPGMKVLQFAFDSRESSNYMPYTYDRNRVVYTGTHDNDTSAGWLKSARHEDIALAREYLGLPESFTAEEGAWAFIRAAMSSVANIAIIQMQDYLALESSARMNVPSTAGGANWQWRMTPLPQDIAQRIALRIAKLTRIMGRS